MRNLYESILDDEEQINQKIENSIAQTCIDFLSHSGFWKFCEHAIKGSDLYVMCKKSYREFKTFDIMMINDQAVFDRSPEEHATIDGKLLEHVYFTGCDFTINVMLGSIPKFLSNCKNCEIQIKDADNDDLKEAAKLLKNTTHNNVIVSGTVRGSDGGVKYYDYDVLNNTDFGKCAITLYNCAHLETLKGLKTIALTLQTWNFYGIKNFNAGDVHKYGLDNLLKNNDITSLGIINQHVQYTDWLVKDGEEYKWNVLKAGAKIVPKIKH